MNDGPAPKKRSIFSVILPYILMAATIGIFIWLIVDNMTGRPVEWARDSLDDRLGYSYNINEETGEVEGDYQPSESLPYRVYAIEVSQGYKAVSVNGVALDSNNRTTYFTVMIEENLWSGEGPGYSIYLDDGTMVYHPYYEAMFTARIDEAKTAGFVDPSMCFISVVDGFAVGAGVCADKLVRGCAYAAPTAYQTGYDVVHVGSGEVVFLQSDVTAEEEDPLVRP